MLLWYKEIKSQGSCGRIIFLVFRKCMNHDRMYDDEKKNEDKETFSS
jgi:hypothetical protein